MPLAQEEGAHFYFFYPGTGDTWRNFKEHFYELEHIINDGAPQAIELRNDSLAKCTHTFKGRYIDHYRVSFDGIGGLSQYKVTDLKFNPHDAQHNYGLTNSSGKTQMSGTDQATGHGMGNLCRFTLDYIERILEKEKYKKENIVRIYLIGFSRGAFTILKILVQDKYKKRWDEISQKFPKLKIISFLGDPVPGLGNNLNDYRISRHVEALNLYFALSVNTNILGTRFLKKITVEDNKTKYCIHPYKSNNRIHVYAGNLEERFNEYTREHQELMPILARNVYSYFFNTNHVLYDKKRDFTAVDKKMRHQNLEYIDYDSHGTTREYSKFIQNKGNRIFLNLIEQFNFKKSFPFIYSYMGFEKLYLEDVLKEEQLEIYLAELPLYYRSFLEYICKKYAAGVHRCLFFKNISFVYQFDLMYVFGEHNLDKMDDLSKITFENSQQRQNANNHQYNVLKHPEEVNLSLYKAIIKNTERFATSGIALLPTNIKKIMESLKSTQSESSKIKEIKDILEKCLRSSSYSRSDFTQNFYFYYYKYLKENSL